MKIGIVSPYPPSKGTLNEYAYHLVENLKVKSEVKEIVIFTDTILEEYPNQENSKGCKVTIVPCWTFNRLTNFWRITTALKKHKVDVALFNIQFLSFGDSKVAGALGLVAPLLSRLMGIPAVTLLHNITETVDYDSAGITSNKLLQAIYSVIGTILTKLLLCSNLLAVTMPKYVKILEKKYKTNNVALIPHGAFEVPDFIPEKEGNLRIMTFGKFGTYKKVEELIEATELVRQRTGKEIELVIAGTDNPNVKGYLAGVESKYRDVKNVIYTGYVKERDVAGLFRDSTVVVFPYTSTTGSSGVLHQAGSYGRAVILPNIGDLKELIEEEGYRGEYFEASNVNSLAIAIENLIENKAYRQQMGEQNYAAAVSLPMSDIADWYLLHFQSLVKSKSLEPDKTVAQALVSHRAIRLSNQK